MKQNITVALHTDGTSELIHGPEVPYQEQRATVHNLRENGLPDFVERVEIWTRNCVKFAHRKASEIARLAEAEAAAIKAKAESLETKLKEDAARHEAELAAQTK